MPTFHDQMRLDDEEFAENHEMLESEDRDMANRLADLERKFLEQSDELMCLKATLAEALRRLSLIENGKVSQSNSTPSTPVRNGARDNNRLRPQSSYKLNVSTSNSSTSSLPQRRAVHYQSTGSLHSDSQSSSSVSPVPSPSPRATPLPASNAIRRNTAINNAAASSSALHKRWNSTGDFNQANFNSRFTNKSFLNLYSTKQQSASLNYRHGTKDAVYNEDDQSVRIYLRGRPIHLPAPTSYISEGYDISKVLAAPQQRLKLDWVYGYRGRDCRANLYLLPTGEMVYFVAAVVVLFNVEEQSQRHYLGHTDDVKCLAIHPNKLLVATGQVTGHEKKEGHAHVRIWDSVGLQTLAIIGLGNIENGVCCVSFSKADGGSLLLAIDDSPDHILTIWDWQRGQKISETKCSVDRVVAADFHPLERGSILTCGKSHIGFWTLDATGALYKRLGIFEGREKPKYVLCAGFLQSGDAITGDSSGNLAVWARGTNTIRKFMKNLHQGSIFSICVLRDGSVVTGGGKDGRIVRLDSDLNRTGEEIAIEGHFGGIRVISEGRGSQLLVGTTKNCILVGSFDLGFQPIILGHIDEVWALASHPKAPHFATSGHDRLLQMWDSLSHGILWSKDIGEQSQSLAFSIDGTVLVVGCLSGRWLVFDSHTRELLAQYADGNEPIQEIKYSPDGKMLILGSRDNTIYVYQCADDFRRYTRIGKCTGHSSYVVHLDWSQDSQMFRSNSGDYEILYWNATTCRQILQTGSIRDIKWATNSCTLTFETLGIWGETIDGSDINSVSRSGDAKLLASGDDFGKVRLYTYPACQPKSLHHQYSGHSSHVTNVTFLQEDSRLISIGGKDTSVLQWIVH